MEKIEWDKIDKGNPDTDGFHTQVIFDTYVATFAKKSTRSCSLERQNSTDPSQSFLINIIDIPEFINVLLTLINKRIDDFE